MSLQDWQFDLPPERIAREPEARRDHSRLLHLAADGARYHLRFDDLPSLLAPGDLLVANDTRVVPARLRAHRRSGGRVELLVLDGATATGPVEALARPAKKLKDGEELVLASGETCTVLGRTESGGVRVDLGPDPLALLERLGEIPLPPYLERDETPEDRLRYQTVYARAPGAVAAPTAGLHFTDPLRQELAHKGVDWATVTLHVGIGTFRPLRPMDLERGALHRESYEVPEATVSAIRACRERGGRVIAVGTTSTRALESATPPGERVPEAARADTRLLIQPGYRFRCVDRLITNFHLPGSSLLLLVAALTGRERLLATYQEAIARGYRFYSYGDATLVDPASDIG